MATNKMQLRNCGHRSIINYMSDQILLKRKAGKDATADLYRASRNWLQKFVNGRDLTFNHVTPCLIDSFRIYLQIEGNLKVNSVNSYLSNFRAIYNKAVREGIVHPQPHPFSHLSMHMEQTARRASSCGVMEEIAQFDFQENQELEMSADLCAFSYLACGIPFIDLAHLTRENIQGKEIIYQRIKTGTSIRIGITSGMQTILEKYSCSDRSYLFPILPVGDKSSYETYKATLRKYNKSLSKIGEQLSEPIHLTSYVVRHTWATEALRHYTPVAIISQALGHTSEKTTRSYLAQLDQSQLNQANAIIIGSVDYLVAGKKKLAG